MPKDKYNAQTNIEPSNNNDNNGNNSQTITYKTTHTAVRKARRFALQGLYEWLMTDRRFAIQEIAPNLSKHHLI